MSLPSALLTEVREGMKPTTLDRIIARVAPSWGVRRLEARATLAAVGGHAWTGARRDTAELRNFNPVATSPDDEQRWDRQTLLDRATDLERNDALAGGIIAEHVLSVVGTGLALHPEPARHLLGWTQDQAAEWAESVKQRFELWASNPSECDLARKRNFYQGQALAYRTVASRGDAFALLPTKRHPGTAWSTKVQLLEGDRCCNPRGKTDTETLQQGVDLLPETGEVRRYWFTKRYPGGPRPLTESDFVSVDAWSSSGRRQVLHLYHEHRLDLRRGYPLLAPVITILKQASRLSEHELAAAVVSSLFAVVIKRSSTGTTPLSGLVKKDDKGASFAELGPALVAEMAANEDIVQVKPERPSGAFDPFWRAIVGQIAMRVQTPPEVLLKKFESSYTAARGALLQFWKFVMVERDMLLAPNYCQPIFETWLAEDVARGGTVAPGFFADPILRAAYCSARWVGDNPPILDPLKEVLAAQELINYGLSTYTEQTLRLTGGDFERNIDKQGRELRLLNAAGIIRDRQPETFGELVPPTSDETPDPENAKPAQGRRAALLALGMKESR